MSRETVEAPEETVDWNTFVNRCWSEHGDAPGAVAASLRRRAAAMPADDDAASRTVGLAEHVWLSHLCDPEGLRAFLELLPAEAAAAPAPAMSLRRVQWVLARMEAPAGVEPEGLPPMDDGPRWRAMQHLWAVWASGGRADDALAMLHREWPRARAHAEVDARRGLASACYNLAVELRIGARGDRDRDALMLALAQAARELWAGAGTWVQVERADYQLARCHAATGDGVRAVTFAQACLDGVMAHDTEPEADAYERFYAHEALAWAQLAAGEPESAAVQRGLMQALIGQVADEQMREWCEASLAEFDTAANSRLTEIQSTQIA